MTATPRRSIEGRPPARYLRTSRDRSQQRQGMRAAVVAAALRLFLDRGHLAVRVEDIVDQVGISRATFYKHFSERDESSGGTIRAAAHERRRLCAGHSAVKRITYLLV